MRRLPILFLLYATTGLLFSQQQSVVVPGSGWTLGPGSRIDNGVLIAGYGSSFSQTLSVSPATVQAWPGRPGYHREGVYLLKFSAGNYFPSYPGYYTVVVSFGTQELCDASKWGMATSTEITIVCPSPGYLIVDKALPLGGPVQGEQPLAIKFTVNDGSANGGWPVLFPNPEKISLTFTPSVSQ